MVWVRSQFIEIFEKIMVQFLKLRNGIRSFSQNEQLCKAKERADKKSRQTTPESGLNGEWEISHDFMCSSCNIVFDDIIEILHHKWEAHPYCLVSHVTLPPDLR